MTTLFEAVSVAKEAIKAGDAIQYKILDGELHVESEQVGQLWWPDYQEDNNFGGLQNG